MMTAMTKQKSRKSKNWENLKSGLEVEIVMAGRFLKNLSRIDWFGNWRK